MDGAGDELSPFMLMGCPKCLKNGFLLSEAGVGALGGAGGGGGAGGALSVEKAGGFAAEAEDMPGAGGGDGLEGAKTN